MRPRAYGHLHAGDSYEKFAARTTTGSLEVREDTWLFHPFVVEEISEKYA